MRCPRCQATVPEESAFCLKCGTRLASLQPGPPGNGSPRTAPAAPPEAGLAPGGKQAYVLSFRPIVDERLRYRVARWVCERAPAHTMTDVQADLTEGSFVTFLALTAEELEAVRQRIEGLGVTSGLVSLAPAGVADFLLPARHEPAKTKPGGMERKDWLKVAIVFGVIAMLAVVVLRLFGS